MNISDLIFELQKIKFDMPIEYGWMQNKSMMHPWGLNIEVFCRTRTLPKGDLVAQITSELESDINWLNRNSVNITNFGVYFYKLPTLKDPFLKYIKLCKTL